MSKKVVLELPEHLLNEVEKFKEEAHMPNKESAILKLIEYAIGFPEYFRNFDWQKAEDEADEEIASGRVKEFASVNELIADLRA